MRVELQAISVDTKQLDDQTLKKMLEHVNQKEEFVVSVAEIKAGRALSAGQTQPLVKKSIVQPGVQEAASRR